MNLTLLLFFGLFRAGGGSARKKAFVMRIEEEDDTEEEDDNEDARALVTGARFSCNDLESRGEFGTAIWFLQSVAFFL